MKGNGAPTTQNLLTFSIQIFLSKEGYDFDLLLHVARIHIPVLNYNKIITTGIQILSYIHAYTKSKEKNKILHLDIAATGDLGKQSLLEHSEILFLFFLSID